ncbi:class I SAM-dependent methyltransferase [Actinospica sp.]|jgi:SAM-dependent methyltransferase|uniref:class I SAM-dependent methyltransferase n=1 Tax=Actinospica sp. TaxID=1872142 RepID=UPI002CA0AAF6|nr:class I SAM-dependent methyltransferase [Actinospica sp.]HWG28716.1 class I SAM-dependent methyltransferase [Actinospica sp.]
MPILPESASELHRYRDVAESFGIDAERYDRARPTYPADLVQRIVAASPGRDVLDVGIGTGISGRLFQAAGCTVLGVEVDERMAEFVRRAGIEVEVSKFEDWDPAGRTFDAVIAAQAWHWVDPIAGAAKAARVLRPGGVFAAFWNVHLPEPDAAEAFGEITHRLAPELPQFYRRGMGHDRTFSAYRDKTEQGLRAAGHAFGEPETWLFDWDTTYTRDGWLDVVPTHGGFAQLPPERTAELLAALGAAIDELGGSIEVHFTTVAVTAKMTATRFPSSPVRGEPEDPSAE